MNVNVGVSDPVLPVSVWHERRKPSGMTLDLDRPHKDAANVQAEDLTQMKLVSKPKIHR